MQLALTLVFVETKRGADTLEYRLSMNGFPAGAIHGDKVQMVDYLLSIIGFFNNVITSIMCSFLMLFLFSLLQIAINYLWLSTRVYIQSFLPYLLNSQFHLRIYGIISWEILFCRITRFS